MTGPPLAVLWAAGLLVVPPAAAGVSAALAGAPPRVAGALFGLAAAVGLVVGWRRGFVAALLVGAFKVFEGGLLFRYAWLNGLLGPSVVQRVLSALGVGLTLLAVLWWPATRRWCGLLPAADTEDDDGQ